MTARPFTGLRVTLVAAFNPRYHRSGLALARALAEVGCEVRRCEGRLRGLYAPLCRPPGAPPGGLLRRAPAAAARLVNGSKLLPPGGAGPVRPGRGPPGGRV